MTHFKPDTKKGKRLVASQAEWSAIRREKLTGRCPVDGCLVSDTDLHHIIPRSLGGGDHRWNLIGLCHGHHMCYEDREQLWLDVADAVRSSLTDEQVSEIVAAKSQVFLDRYYPFKSLRRSNG